MKAENIYKASEISAFTILPLAISFYAKAKENI